MIKIYESHKGKIKNYQIMTKKELIQERAIFFMYGMLVMSVIWFLISTFTF